MKNETPKHSKTRTPRGRRGAKPASAGMNQATTKEFDREEMGIAPKE